MRQLWFIALLTIYCNAFAIEAAVFDVSDHEYLYSNIENLTFYPIDAHKNLINSLNLKLSDMAEVAAAKSAELTEAEVLALIDEQQMTESFEPLKIAFEYGIKQIPAICFAKCQHVIYGSTHVPTALQAYALWNRKAQG